MLFLQPYAMNPCSRRSQASSCLWRPLFDNQKQVLASTLNVANSSLQPHDCSSTPFRNSGHAGCTKSGLSKTWPLITLHHAVGKCQAHWWGSRTSNPVWGAEGRPRWVRFPCTSARLQIPSPGQSLLLMIACTMRARIPAERPSSYFRTIPKSKTSAICLISLTVPLAKKH
jgi:hypothetical protein